MDQNDRDKKATKEKKKSTKTDNLKMSFDEKRKKMKLMIKKHFFFFLSKIAQLYISSSRLIIWSSMSEAVFALARLVTDVDIYRYL